MFLSKWMVIFLQMMMLVPAIGRSKQLSGRILRGCALVEYPYVVRQPGAMSRFLAQRNEFGSFSGLAIQYLRLMEEELGFTTDLRQWHGTPNALVHHIRSCQPQNSTFACKCDIGVGAFIVTEERMEQVDFIWPFSGEHHRMIIRAEDIQPENAHEPGFFLRVFSGEVWFFVFLAIFVYAIGSMYLRGRNEKSNRIQYHEQLSSFNDNTDFSQSADETIPPPRRQGSDNAQDSTTLPLKKRETTSEKARLDFKRTLLKEDHKVRVPTGATLDCVQNSKLQHSTSHRFANYFASFASLRKHTHGNVLRFGKRLASVFHQFFRHILLSLRVFVGHPAGEELYSEKIMKLAWQLLAIMSGIFLLLVFAGGFTANVFESTGSSRFETLDDVRRCAVKPWEVSFVEGSATEYLWDGVILSHGFCTKKGVKDPPIVRAASLDDGFQLLTHGKVNFLIALEGQSFMSIWRRCNEFAIVGRPFISTPIAFILPKDSSLTDLLSATTLRLREQDKIEQARTIAERHTCRRGITVTLNLLGAFFLVYFLLVLIILIIEWCKRRRRYQ